MSKAVGAAGPHRVGRCLLAIGVVGSLLAGCGESVSSSLCATLTSAQPGFASSEPRQKLAAIDAVMARVATRDRKLIAPVRDYAAILYGRSHWSEARQLAFLTRFFKVDAPALDTRLRDECRIPLDRHIAPFQIPAGAGT